MFHGLLVRPLDPADLPHPAWSSGGPKRSQQLLLLLDRQVLMATTSPAHRWEDGFAFSQVLGLQPPHRSRLPANGTGHLIGREPQRGPQPQALHALQFCFAPGLVERPCQPSRSSLAKRLGRSHSLLLEHGVLTEESLF